MRSPRTATKSSPCLPQLEKSLRAATKTQRRQKTKPNQTSAVCLGQILEFKGIPSPRRNLQPQEAHRWCQTAWVPVLPGMHLEKTLLPLCFSGLIRKTIGLPHVVWTRQPCTACDMLGRAPATKQGPSVLLPSSPPPPKHLPVSYLLSANSLMFYSPRQFVGAINMPLGREIGFFCLNLKGFDAGGM